jgi:hypothetical protein
VITYVCKYPGSFILMKIHVVKKDIMTKMNPSEVSNSLFSFGCPSLAKSRIMKPIPPIVNKKELAKPSIMYCPFTRYGKKATGFEYPFSIVLPIDGGSTIIS